VRRPWPLAALIAVLALAGCGNERGELQQQRPDEDSPRQTVRYRAVGMTVEVPRVLDPVRRQPPAVFRLVLGQPLVSAFAYRRREVIPRRPAEVRAAMRRLTKAVERRDPDFDLGGRRILRVAGAPAVELVGEQTLAGGRLRTRSVHVYKGRAEYVFELLAPPRRFRQVDRGVFQPMLDSAKLTGRVRPERKRD
jgi:hypothetical protein